MIETVFVKGHLTFSVEQQDLEFIHQNVSVFGVTGLPWGVLSAKNHFGREVMTTLRIPGDAKLSFWTRAYIMREYTVFGSHMGLKFQMEPEAHERLSAHVQKHGAYPTEYLRKYPRIPADSSIQTFPLRVLAFPDGVDQTQNAPLILDVSNLSPNGILLNTENQMALSIQPGNRLHLILEPRGWFPMQIRVQGLVCRVVDELHPSSGNLIRYFGIKFARVDDVNRTAFLDLLRDILSQMKLQGSAKA
jgi:hypothetical protein